MNEHNSGLEVAMVGRELSEMERLAVELYSLLKKHGILRYAKKSGDGVFLEIGYSRGLVWLFVSSESGKVYLRLDRVDQEVLFTTGDEVLKFWDVEGHYVDDAMEEMQDHIDAMRGGNE